MVLTNFECWATGDDVPCGQVDPFHTRGIQAQAAAVSHISSNGYYGFSYVNVGLNNNNMETTNNVASATGGKKRFFNEDCGIDDFDMTGDVVRAEVGGAVAAKRCRFDDYTAVDCNDVLPPLTSTQIGTQSCLLMDTEDLGYTKQHQQPQEDATMTSIVNNETYTTNSDGNSQVNKQSQPQQQQTQPAQQQQQRFQGHLHRANRDVSRCMLSHMI